MPQDGTPQQQPNKASKLVRKYLLQGGALLIIALLAAVGLVLTATGNPPGGHSPRTDYVLLGIVAAFAGFIGTAFLYMVVKLRRHARATQGVEQIEQDAERAVDD